MVPTAVATAAVFIAPLVGLLVWRVLKQQEDLPLSSQILSLKLQHPLGAQAKAQEEKTANQLQEAVGTVSSFGANEQDFLDRIESTKEKHPELSVGDAINRTLHTAVSQKFGSGVGSATMKMGEATQGKPTKTLWACSKPSMKILR
ncbi:hypothetical protein WJ968_33060 [Achromobacter xylosoxidans]